MQDFDEWAQDQIAAILEHFGFDDYDKQILEVKNAKMLAKLVLDAPWLSN